MNILKGIIFDLDGTATPMQENALPSKRLVSDIAKIDSELIISAATGRSMPKAKSILKELNLSDPCIVYGGAQIVDPRNENIFWEKRIPEKQVREIINICRPYSYELLFSDESLGEGAPASRRSPNGPELIIYIMAMEKKDSETVAGELRKIGSLSVHGAGSWTEGRVDLHVTHGEANKKHAVEEWLNIVGAKKEEIAGAGDNDNDLPLLETVGYKIAMGNATKKLKAIADYIAPTINEDGLAVAIEKLFIPNK